MKGAAGVPQTRASLSAAATPGALFWRAFFFVVVGLRSSLLIIILVRAHAAFLIITLNKPAPAGSSIPDDPRPADYPYERRPLLTPRTTIRLLHHLHDRMDMIAGGRAHAGTTAIDPYNNTSTCREIKSLQFGW